MPRRRSNLGRRTRGAEAVRRVIANQTEEERASANERNRQRIAQKRAEEAVERRAARLEDARLRARRSRSAASDLLRSRLRVAKRRQRETAAQHQTRLRAQHSNKHIRNIVIKEESLEDNPLDFKSDNEEKSEDEVWVEERTLIPVVKIEPEDPLLSEEKSEDENLRWVEENPEIILVKVEPEDPPEMKVKESQAACASGLSRMTRRPVKREQGLEQESPLVRGIKREASPSPSTSPNPYRDAAGGGELSTMRQLLSTLQRPVDDDEVFGAHVASELRALRRPHLKRKLKRLVQEAILAVSKEDDD